MTKCSHLVVLNGSFKYYPETNQNYTREQMNASIQLLQTSNTLQCGSETTRWQEKDSNLQDFSSEVMYPT